MVRITLMTWPTQGGLDLLTEIVHITSRSFPSAFIRLLRVSFDDPGKLTALAIDYPADTDLPLILMALSCRIQQERNRPDFAEPLKKAFDLLNRKSRGPSDIPVLPTTTPGTSLSRREREIALLAGASSNAEIAVKLGLSVRTVESHLHNALQKTGLTSRRELFEVACK
ncbi:conserved hypothetical protein [Leifsonia xyli subsp. xyli str. CTCB07]|uniref:HTH luxR-type domain-containing protein n=2 Tax=Leifsonia xyli subsp. xyli TaxID=59736 RepID=Q6AEH3_LEIXX|nr:conserved hypothetical protein [Leifsonia xyli subsp. xyli str. CTCB07]